MQWRSTGVRLLVALVIASIGYMALTRTVFAPDNPEVIVGKEAAEVEAFVRAHIQELSPRDPVLGGAFYVTEISVGAGVGTVSYEDGHILLTAVFEYDYDDTTGQVRIREFTVQGD